MAEVTLRPLTEDELDAYLAHDVIAYAKARHSAGAEPTFEQALEKSRQHHAELLPDGLATAGMLLMRAEIDSVPIGLLWLALPDASPMTDAAWICDIEVDADKRGAGHGRAILAAGERLLRDRGVRRVALNVFADNAVAKALYASAGYQIAEKHGSGWNMLKELEQ